MQPHDFQSEYDLILEMHNNNDRSWTTIEHALDRLKNRAREQYEREQADELKIRIKQERRERFEQAYEQYDQQLLNGELPTSSDINECVKDLQELAEPSLNELRIRIQEFRDRWRGHKRLRELREKVKTYIENYNQAIANGMDFIEAANEFLEPTEKLINVEATELGDSPEINKLLADVRKAIKDADQSALITNAITAQFRTIIEELNNKAGNEPHMLVDMKRKIHGTVPRAEAIEWYSQQAENYAESKADEYLRKARQYVNRAEYVLASYILDAADALYLLPKYKDDEVQAFRRDLIEPQQRRIINARTKLQSVRNAPNVEIAQQYFEEALSPELGWPDFENLEQQRQQALAMLAEEFQDDGSADESSLVEQARNHIYEAMGREFSRWQDQDEMFHEGHRLIFQLTEDDLARMEDYLSWGDARLSVQNGALFNILKENFYRQFSERDNLLKAAEKARQAIRAKDYKQAYDDLKSYAKILEQERDTYYRAAYDLWVEAQAMHGIWQIKEEVDAVIRAGFDAAPQRLGSEKQRVLAIFEKAQAARITNPNGANDTGLTSIIRDLQDMLNLIEALICENDNRIAEALAYIRPISKRRESPFYPEVQQRLQEWEDLIVGGEAISHAIAEAETARQRGDIKAAYYALKAHIEEKNYEGYTELVRRLAQIKLELTAIVRQEIEDNIEQMPESPTQLEQLKQLLQEVNRAAYDAIVSEINQALAIQTAFYCYRQAENTQDAGLWRAAVEAWQQVDDPYYRQIRLVVQEAYTVALTNQELDRSVNITGGLKAVNEKLARVLESIDELEATNPESKQVNLLRARIWIRIAELETEPQYVRAAIQSTQAALHQCSDENKQSPEYQDIQWRLKQAEGLLAAADQYFKIVKGDNSLKNWQFAIEQWDGATIDVQDLHQGLKNWRDELDKELIQDLEKTIQNVPEMWQQIEPMTKLYLLNQHINTDTLDQQVDVLGNVTGRAIEAYGGNSHPNTMTEIEYLEHLIRAANALLFIFGVLQKESLQDFSETENEIIGISRSLETKIQELKQVYQIIARAHERLTTACANGNFSAVEKEMNYIIGGQAIYGNYGEHVAVQELQRAIEESQNERQRLLSVAESIHKYLVIEQFILVQQKLPVLLDTDATGFLASHMVNMVDPYAHGEILDDALDIEERIEDKLQEINLLVKWLTPLIERGKLMKVVRPKEDELPLDFPPLHLATTHIVDFKVVETENIEPLRSTRQYADAIEELDHLEFGGVNDQNAPAQNYRNGNQLSLEKAFVVLQSPPIDNELKLRSKLAVAIFRWAAQLWQQLDEYLNYCEQLRKDLIRSDVEFRKERQRFYDAYTNLQNRVGDKKENLKTLADAYRKIRGGHDVQGTIQREDIYPLAHNWPGLDQQYNTYRNEISRLPL